MTNWMSEKSKDGILEFRKKHAKDLLYGYERRDRTKEESFYFVNLTNGANQTLGMRSRDTDDIYLCNSDYSINMDAPLEGSGYKYVRDCTSFDL